MKNFVQKSAWILTVTGLVLMGSHALVWADAGPTDEELKAAGQEPASQDQASAPETSEPAADHHALGQFGQTETAPVAQTQAVAQPASSNPNNPTGMDFPKVKDSQDEYMAKKFSWWPSDAKPAPYKDPDRSGFWWWPNAPGTQKDHWGNQGYIYVRKLIFDYKSSEGEMKPSLVIKRIIKNVKVYFDYDKSDLRDDAVDALSKALYTLNHEQNTDILITGNADVRGSEQYNEKLGEKRASSVEKYLIDKGLSQDRIRILSRGKMDALAPTNDIVGMQKDRNAQFMIAEVEEVMIPASQAASFQDKVIEERQEVEGAVKVDTKEYTIKSGDTLWKIAQENYGDGKQWKRLYEFNKDVIKDPNKPRKGTRIKIPIE